MNKKLVILAGSACALVSACNMGSSTTGPLLNASQLSGSTCTGMVTGDTCQITLSYNTNGTSSPALTYSPNPMTLGTTNNNTFTSQVQNCQALINSNSNSTCAIVINYVTTGSQTSANVSFSLGGSSATPAITLSGN